MMGMLIFNNGLHSMLVLFPGAGIRSLSTRVGISMPVGATEPLVLLPQGKGQIDGIMLTPI